MLSFLRGINTVVFSSLILGGAIFAENPVLKREAGKILKIDRVNAYQEIKKWSDETKAQVSKRIKELEAADLAPVLEASSQSALDLLKSEEFSSELEDILFQVKRKSWESVLKDLQSKLSLKNLRLQDLLSNPEIIKTLIAYLEVKEKAFWTAHAQARSRVSKPITEASPESLLPTGSLEEGLQLIAALSKYFNVEIESKDSNILLRYFISK